MPGKPLDQANLENDLKYILTGTPLHTTLRFACPSRRDSNVLEPGCGSGKYGIGYALDGAHVTLVDIDEGVLEYTRALLKMTQEHVKRQLDVTIMQGNLHELEKVFGRDKFDYCISEGLIHHWTDGRRQWSLVQMTKVIKPGGIVFTACSNALCQDMLDYANRVQHTYEGMPPVQVPLTPMELAQRLYEAGLEKDSINVAPVGTEEWQSAMLIAGWGKKPGGVS